MVRKNKSKRHRLQVRKHIQSLIDDQDDDVSSVECSPCADCEIIISDDDVALQCDLCYNWYCASCMKIEKCVYDFFNKSEESQGIMWFCSHCRKSLPSTKN